MTYNKNNMNDEGIGLGLNNCKNLVRLLGPQKKLHISSELDKGSTFTF